MIEYYQKLSTMIEFREGKPYWVKVSKYSNREVGELAGTITNKGYRQFCIRVNRVRRSILGHRLLWFKYYGVIPKVLDHINRDPDDNRIENLRECTISENSRNIAKRQTSSKYMGVTQRPYGRWETSLRVKKKKVYIGVFDTELEAAKAYDEACFKYGVDEFANLNFPNAYKEIENINKT